MKPERKVAGAVILAMLAGIGLVVVGNVLETPEGPIWTPAGKAISAVPAASRRVFSWQEVPEEYREALYDSFDHSKGLERTSLRPDERAELAAEMKADARQMADRSDAWLGGCMAGRHFLEAGKTEKGWWIFYEAGGIVDGYNLVVMEEGPAGPKIVKDQGFFPHN